jgi:hypothetical protein
MAKGIKSVVASMDGMAPRCETQDTAYLKGMQEGVYYSSLTDGLAGSTMITMAPTTGSATNAGSSSNNAAVNNNNKAKSFLSLGWGPSWGQSASWLLRFIWHNPLRVLRT